MFSLDGVRTTSFLPNNGHNTKRKIAHLSCLRRAFFHSPKIFKQQALCKVLIMVQNAETPFQP